jgi:hypothetical protein
LRSFCWWGARSHLAALINTRRGVRAQNLIVAIMTAAIDEATANAREQLARRQVHARALVLSGTT